MPKHCQVPECERPLYARGCCVAHYARLRKHGDVQADLPVGSGRAPRQCGVSGCEMAHYAHGYCSGHYQRVRMHGDPLADKALQLRQDIPCQVSGCSSPARSRGLCSAHYRRLLKHGDVYAADPVGRHHRPGMGPPPRIPGVSTRRDHGYVLVWVPDHPDADAQGYVRQHRLVMEELLGRRLFPDEIAHHKNGQRDDNRPENLELCVHRQPPGQRVVDLVAFARELLDRYGAQFPAA